MTTETRTGGRPATVQTRQLTSGLETRMLDVEEAVAEFWLGIRADDIRLACAAARRVESLGALAGENVRKYERLVNAKPAPHRPRSQQRDGLRHSGG